MPRIQRFVGDKITKSPLLDPEAATRSTRASISLGKDIAEASLIGGYAAKRVNEAERAVKAQKLENDLVNDFKDAAATYKDRTDYEKFEDDAARQMEEIRAKRVEEIGDDKKLTQAFNLAFDNYSRGFQRTVRAKRAEVIAQKGLGEYAKSYDTALHDYASEMDADNRESIKALIKIKALTLAKFGIMTPVQAEASIQQFDDQADSVRADYVMDNMGPELFLQLKAQGEFDGLDPKIAQEKEQKAKTKIEATIKEKDEIAKQLVADHKIEMANTVSGFIRKNQFVNALEAIENSALDEKDKLALENKVRTAIKTGLEPTEDPNVNAQLLIKLQDPTYDRKQLRDDIANAVTGLKIKAERGSTYYNGIDDPIFKDEYFKAVNEMYRRHFGWRADKETFMHPEGAVSYDIAISQLLARIKDKEKPLIGEDIRKEGIKIGLPLFQEFWTKIKWMTPVEAARNARRLAESVGISVPKHTPPPDEPEGGPEGKKRPPLGSFHTR